MLTTEPTTTTEAGLTDFQESVEERPSASFICAISEFLNTDPKDLLVELGYYEMGIESELDQAGG